MSRRSRPLSPLLAAIAADDTLPIDPIAVDLWMRDLQNPLRWFVRPLLQLVFGESGAAVDKVMVDGRMVLENGRMLTLDEDRLRRDAEAAALRLDAANEPAAAFARSFGDAVGLFCIGLARHPHHVERKLPEPDAI